MELALTQNTKELNRLECIITRNLQSFYEVGRALMEIRDKGLYRDVLGFETFEAYCKSKWDFASNYARRLITSAETFDNIKSVPIGTVPTTESQTRPLSKLEPDQQREAWQKAVESAPEGKVTASIVTKIVKEMKTTTTESIKTIKQNNTNNNYQDELISSSFKQAWDNFFNELKNAKALKWSTTSRESAVKHIQVLMDVATIN